MKNLKKIEDFILESVNILDELQKKYPNSIITMKPHDRFKGSYFARVDILKQDGEKEYLGALRGPMSEEQALEFFDSVLSKNYDNFTNV